MVGGGDYDYYYSSTDDETAGQSESATATDDATTSSHPFYFSADVLREIGCPLQQSAQPPQLPPVSCGGFDSAVAS